MKNDLVEIVAAILMLIILVIVFVAGFKWALFKLNILFGWLF